MNGITKAHEMMSHKFSVELQNVRREFDLLASTLVERLQEERANMEAWKPEIEKLHAKLHVITEDQKTEANKVTGQRRGCVSVVRALRYRSRMSCRRSWATSPVVPRNETSAP